MPVQENARTVDFPLGPREAIAARASCRTRQKHPSQRPQSPGAVRSNRPKPMRTDPQETKQAVLIAMLRAPNRATLAELVDAISWQGNSGRGGMVARRKKKDGVSGAQEEARAHDRNPEAGTSRARLPAS